MSLLPPFRQKEPDTKFLPPHAIRVSDLLRHLTISRDQTSASRIVEERLVALAKTTDFVIARPKGPVVETNEGIEDELNGPGSEPNKVTIDDYITGLNNQLDNTDHLENFDFDRLLQDSDGKDFGFDPSAFVSSSEDNKLNSALNQIPNTSEPEPEGNPKSIGGRGWTWATMDTGTKGATNDAAASRGASERKKGASKAADKSPALDSRLKDDLWRRLKFLEQENQRLTEEASATRPRESSSPELEYVSRTFYKIHDDVYLEPPQWKKGPKGYILRADIPLEDQELYLDQHPEIAFVFYKEYNSPTEPELTELVSKDGVFRTPQPSKESLVLISEDVIIAVEKLNANIPGLSSLFPDFDPTKEMVAPYMFMFCSLPLLERVECHLSSLESHLLNQLIDCILERQRKEYDAVKRCNSQGTVSKRLMKYLVRPGDVLVSTEGSTVKAYIATTWAKESTVVSTVPRQRTTRWASGSMHLASRMMYGDCGTDMDEMLVNAHEPDSPEPSQHLKHHTYTWIVNAWDWGFNGVFSKKDVGISIHLDAANENEEVKVNSLDYFPLRFDSGDLRSKLERRGRTFWQCRYRKFVSYQEAIPGGLSSIGERYMIDIQTYKTLHPKSTLAHSQLISDFSPEVMAQDRPPEGDSLLLFPSSIQGYNLRVKKWEDLDVDRITDVEWNKQAFKTLVAHEKTKELVEALVTNRLAAEKSTDVIHGKGNGLIILLHGGPGVGKTFTAEGVAEIAEKPLYRVTCGDIGTKPEEVEKYLESVFYLAKIWDCVVLLDEADVFLEERGLADLQRNALVSVFLRVLEYNVGILILTSNRVGTFDEAFKSRIQLALHYENLTGPQQRKIWRNFLTRIKDFDEQNIELEDITDHLDDLAKQDMNGRQIRNAITIARQLAQYRGQKFCYEHLKDVIEVSWKFEGYLKDLRGGLSDDHLKREDGLR